MSHRYAHLVDSVLSPGELLVTLRTKETAVHVLARIRHATRADGEHIVDGEMVMQDGKVRSDFNIAQGQLKKPPQANLRGFLGLIPPGNEL